MKWNRTQRQFACFITFTIINVTINFSWVFRQAEELPGFKLLFDKTEEDLNASATASASASSTSAFVSSAEPFKSTMHVNGSTNDIPERVLSVLEQLDILSGGPQASNLECPPPLIPFQNVIKQSTNNATIAAKESDLKIPRILHVSMKSRCVPQDIARILERWKSKLPNYSIIFHDDDAVEKLISEEWPEFPTLHKAMRCVLFKGAMKIDIWRVLILYKYGGVYTDIDVWPKDAMHESVIRNDLSAYFFTDVSNRPSQWFMSTEPRHPMMQLYMLEILHNVLKLNNIQKPKLIHVTGPAAVFNAYKRFLSMNWELSTHNISVQNNIEVEGPYGKVVMKDRKGFKYVGMKWDFGDIVPYNGTNVTRGERIRLESGVQHWHKRRKFDLHPNAKSCLGYIRAVDEGWLNTAAQSS